MQQFPSGVRAAVVDGVTPWRSPGSPGGDAAQWAAATLVSALSLPLGLQDAYVYANGVLHRPDLHPSRRQAMAAAAAADCVLNAGCVEWSALVSGDCEVWVADGFAETPRLSLGGDFVRADVRRDWVAMLEANVGAWSFDDRLRQEAEFFEDSATQVCHAVGRYSTPTFVAGRGLHAVLVVASDGACISEAVAEGVSVGDIDQWLVHVSERSVRDDLSCLIVAAE